MIAISKNRGKKFPLVCSSLSLNRLLIKLQLVSPRLQKSPWFLRQTVVATARKSFESDGGACL
jgi:hypothetical protein